MRAILHNIRSIHNVGSIFRTADGLGVEKLFLTGYTPAPVDRFGRKRQAFKKVALGAEETVEWEEGDDLMQVIQNLQAEDNQVVACETTESATDIGSFSPRPQDICLVFGNEVDGIPKAVIAESDQVIKIPMQGEKSSLNVAVAFGICVYSFIDKSE